MKPASPSNEPCSHLEPDPQDDPRAVPGPEPADSPAIVLSRRGVLLAGLAGVASVMTGCGRRQATASSGMLGRKGLPGPAWNARPIRPDQYSVSLPSSTPQHSIDPAPRRAPRPYTPAPQAPMTGQVVSRSKWSKGRPVPALMRPMIPVQYITVHHDGMRPFFGTGQREVGARIEAIRRAHRGRGWGDIGYHYVVDRSGKVWAARPTTYQGAHVKNYNPGNIGVVCLGNFDEQSPSTAQLRALDSHLGGLMRAYRVSASRVRTHQEWAATRCPGTALQRHMDSVRHSLG